MNLKNFSVVTEAIARMNVGGKEARVSNTSLGHAPLAIPEVVDLGSEYAQVTVNPFAFPPAIFVCICFAKLSLFVRATYLFILSFISFYLTFYSCVFDGIPSRY